jgi:hypothetical protein
LVQFEIVIAAANTDAATGVFGGLLMLIIGLFIILLGIAWIIFPFIVLNSLGKIEKLLANQNQTLAQIADRQNEANRASSSWSIKNESSVTIGQAHPETIAIRPLVWLEHATVESFERFCRRSLLCQRSTTLTSEISASLIQYRKIIADYFGIAVSTARQQNPTP